MSAMQIAKLVEAVRANGGFIIDDDAPVDTAFKPGCLGVLKDQHGEHLVPIFHTWVFPKTPIYISDDGKPHMRRVDRCVMSTEGIDSFYLPSVCLDVSLVMDN